VRNYDFAVEVAECRNLVKGYGETHARGLARFETIMAELPRLAGSPNAARELEGLRKAATTDETGAALAEAVRLSQTPTRPATAA
jgi:indolepyruvate ferredoxin oxidoreductase beta subunit